MELELRILEEAADRQFWAEHNISRILSVVGSPDNSQNISALMQDTGVQLDTAVMEETLNLLRSGECFQLVLLDWEDCGPQAAKILRFQLPDSVPLLLLAEFDATGMEEILQLTYTDTLVKPFFVSALRTKIRELWNEKVSGPEPEDAEPLKGMHFLAAEDNEINAEILTELLELEGASCEIAENGLLALERFQSSVPGEFDAILMDVQMPVMNGHEAARAIRALEREDAGRIPIIAMTANAFAEDEKAAMDAGMDFHVAKPLDMDILKKVIEQFRRKESL